MKAVVKERLLMCHAIIMLTVRLAPTVMYLHTGHSNQFAVHLGRRWNNVKKMNNVQFITTVGIKLNKTKPTM